MDLVSQIYGTPTSSIFGHSLYIVLVKNHHGRIYVINTAHPKRPKSEYDWLCLNFMHNISDITLQTSRNTQTEKKLRISPYADILSNHGYSVINKPRCCVIYSTLPNTINYECDVFKDPIYYAVYSKVHGHSDYPVFVSENFDIDYMKKQVKCLYPDINREPTVVFDCGAKLFNILLELKQCPEYLMWTEFEGDDDNDYLAGEINMELVGNEYIVVSEGGRFENEWGRWSFKVYKRVN